MTDLADRSAVEVSALLADGRLSAEDYVKACIERIDARDNEVRAWAYFDREHALRQAQALDAQRAAGKPTGPLFGLPVGIKDIIETADMPTEHGSALFEGNQPERDASCVAALRAAGAVIMGKTVTTELANVHPSKTRNPHNVGHTPGGSSAGSGAGVASGMIPLALGTQTGGSVIRPASFNGVYGLKPTLGFISRTGVLLQSHTLDTVGVYGRSVGDLALIADALSAHDPSDEVSYPRAGVNLRGALGTPLAGQPRFAFCKTPAWDEHVEPVTRQAFERLQARLGTACIPLDMPSPFERINEMHRVVMSSENNAYYGPWLARSPDKMSKTIGDRLRAGASVTGAEYVKALNDMQQVYADLARALDTHDAILAPSSPGPAPEGFASTGNAIFNGLWTLLGVPCVSLPVFKDARGMPFGLQLIGKRRGEAKLLRVAQWLDNQLKANPV